MYRKRATVFGDILSRLPRQSTPIYRHTRRLTDTRTGRETEIDRQTVRQTHEQAERKLHVVRRNMLDKQTLKDVDRGDRHTLRHTQRNTYIDTQESQNECNTEQNTDRRREEESW